eukprot:s1286_g2.t1
MYQRPNFLKQLDGPHFTVTLNHNDHRFADTFTKGMTSKQWTGKQNRNSKSRTIGRDDESDWISKLKFVHEWAWTKVPVAQMDNEEFQCENPKTPGQIPETVIGDLKAYLYLQLLPPKNAKNH